MRTIYGLTDDQVLEFEARAETAMLIALQRVMDVIADRIGAIQTASAYVDTYSRVRVLVAANGEDMEEDDGLPPGQSYVSPDDLASVSPLWAEAAEQLLIPLVAEVWNGSAGAVHANLVDATGVTTLPSVGSLAAEQYLAQARNTFAEVGDELWGTARDQLAEGFEQGESIPELAARLRDSAGITGRKAVLVARTQVIEASNAGSIATARASELEMKKEWMATPDKRTRPTHTAADGQQVGLDEKFVVGGFEADFPADPSLPPSERYSCRCAQGYIMAEAEVKQAQRDSVPTPPLPGTSGTEELIQSPIAAETDPALKMTVAQLRAIAKDNDVPLTILGTRKADIVRGLRNWESSRAIKLDGLPLWRTPVVRPGGAAEAPRLGVPARGRPMLTGTSLDDWADYFKRDLQSGRHEFVYASGDTPLEGVRVRDLRVLPGARDGSFPEYVVDNGTAWRIDGVAYLIEHGPNDFGAPWVSRALAELQEAHRTIPAALRANKSYVVLTHANPADVYWRKRFNNPGHTSHMSAGRGHVTVYGFTPQQGIKNAHDSLRHESGHNVDDLIGRQARGSQSYAWSDAATSDAGVVSRAMIQFRVNNLFDLAPEPDASRDWPNGVTRYGQSSAGEDFAESVRLYQSGQIAWGRLDGPRGDAIDMYFRDLFPARAAILDVEFPDIAAAQKVEIAAARAPKVPDVPAQDLSKLTVARLRVIAKERGVVVPAGTRKPDLVKLLEVGPPRVMSAAEKAAAEGKALRKAARETNKLIEARAGTAKLLAEIDELVANKASRATILQRLDPKLIEPEQIYADTDPAVLRSLRTALESGDPVKLRTAITRSGTTLKIKAIGKSGAKTKFDPDAMDALGADIPDGAQVIVVTRGSTLTLPDGKIVQLAKAKVRTVAKKAREGDGAAWTTPDRKASRTTRRMSYDAGPLGEVRVNTAIGSTVEGLRLGEHARVLAGLRAEDVGAYLDWHGFTKAELESLRLRQVRLISGDREMSLGSNIAPLPFSKAEVRDLIVRDAALAGKSATAEMRADARRYIASLTS